MTAEPGEMRDSLRLREAGELVGRWSVSAVNLRCRLDFLGERVESANAWRLTDPGRCLAAIVPGAVGWRPAPDGIELVGADRLTLILFDAEGRATARDGTALALVRDQAG